MVSEEDWALCEGPKVAVSRLFETDSVRVYSHLHYLRGIYEMTSSRLCQGRWECCSCDRSVVGFIPPRPSLTTAECSMTPKGPLDLGHRILPSVLGSSYREVLTPSTRRRRALWKCFRAGSCCGPPASSGSSGFMRGPSSCISTDPQWGSGSTRAVVFFLGGGFLELSGYSDAPSSEKVSLWLQVSDAAAVGRELEKARVVVVEPPQPNRAVARDADTRPRRGKAGGRRGTQGASAPAPLSSAVDSFYRPPSLTRPKDVRRPRFRITLSRRGRHGRRRDP